MNASSRLILLQGPFAYAPSPGPAWFLFWLSIFHGVFALVARDPEVGAMPQPAPIVQSGAAASAGLAPAITTNTADRDDYEATFRSLSPNNGDASIAHEAEGSRLFVGNASAYSSSRPALWMLCMWGLALGFVQGIQMIFLPAGLVMPLSWGSYPFDIAYFIAGLAGMRLSS